MRWVQLLSVDARSLLRDIHQILIVFIDLARTYCSPVMVNLKFPSIYGRIDGLRERDMVVGGVVMRSRQCKYFGIGPNRTALPCGNFGAVLPGRLCYCMSLHCMSMSSDSGRYPNKRISCSDISDYPFPACPFSQPPQLQVHVVGQNVGGQSCSCHTN